jgi:branched-chain amino acid transport system permease protein
MVVIGGTGTVLGPVIGSIFMTAVFATADIFFVQTHAVMAGILIILVMRFMPNGLMGLVPRKEQ